MLEKEKIEIKVTTIVEKRAKDELELPHNIKPHQIQ